MTKFTSSIKIILLVSIASFLYTECKSQQVQQYHFRNSLNEQGGFGPALNMLGTGTFINESLAELSCLSRTVYSFNLNEGVQYDNLSAGNFLGESYSIEMYFQFLNTTGFKRIIDYKNRTTDLGLYCTSTQLLFYDELTVNSTAFVNNQYVHLTVTRDSSTEIVSVYIDGSLAGTFTDVAGKALTDTSGVLNFFQDDLVFGGEASPGTIAMLRLYNYTLDDTEVAAAFAGMEVSSGTVSFTPDSYSDCLEGNLFSFANTSQSAGLNMYSWEFGDGGTSSSTNTSHSYLNAGTYNVILIADGGAGCIDSFTVSLEVFPQPVFDLGSDVNICSGTSATLDAGTFASYLWSDGSTTQTILVSAPGIIYATVTDSNGCTALDSVTVALLGLPVVDIGTDTTLCAGASILVSAPAGYPSYLWNTGETSQGITVDTSGQFYVDVTDGNGCIGTDTIAITFNAPLAVTLGADTTICDGSPLILDAGAGFIAYLWNNGDTTQTTTVSSAQLISVLVTDAFGCSASDTLEVFTIPAPNIDLGPDQNLCGGTTLSLDAGSGFASYLWNDGTVAQTLDVTIGGVYSVTVTDSTGCSSTDQITLTLTPLVNLGADTSSCDTNVVLLDPGPGFVSYLWNDGSTTQTINAASTGLYSVTVTDTSGCVNSDTISITFNSSPVVFLGNDTTLCDGTPIILDAGSGTLTYQWNTGDLTQTLLVTAAGYYQVTVTNSSSCTATDGIIIDYYAPVPTPTITQVLNTLECSLAATYQWFSVPGGIITGATAQTYAPPQNGTFYVVVTDTNGCESLPSNNFIFVNTGIAGLSDQEIQVYPNPASTYVMIQTADVTANKIIVELINILGKSIYKNEHSAKESIRLNIAAHPSGIYFLKVSNSDQDSIHRLIITK